ncbi:ABC transporter related protein [Caldicellulosiruptor saccharolyticus DSM 8903]|uniref:ABC transporter related protein n=1 Tax=Caldicellulosiruptor saccharolyticus (strain ATCC 43494 / DSM 8903 / Tp8T 6331) TaxID=351627 RepID=A4XM77_CALS8|nr:ABC transporter ATP-binding protein [Caldicellulosiruptor saccharolyticus]ABP68012.1 ABC transporter related protein [Caldicellulosiruptor saccharolyticus DSM 8903]
MSKILSVSELYMDYGQGNVLNGISFEVEAGQIIGYIGPNGAGKSTTIKIFLGIITNYKGKVEIFGEDIRGKYLYKRKIGYVPEVIELYESLTAMEYLNFVGQLYGLDEETVKKRSLELIEIFDLKDAINSRLSTYSKGMKQKLAIISSLIHNPDLLFFDEPLTGLDANSATIFKELMKELKKEGKTIFYSSHIMEVVEKVSDRIILLNKGTIVADGPFEELAQKLKQSNLEQLFNELTGFTNHQEIAKEVVKVIKGEKDEG